MVHEPVQLAIPAEARAPKQAWGHLGAMEFGIGVTNLEKAYKDLTDAGKSFLCSPQTLEVQGGEYKYAYIVEPDGLPLSLVEQRY